MVSRPHRWLSQSWMAHTAVAGLMCLWLLGMIVWQAGPAEIRPTSVTTVLALADPAHTDTDWPGWRGGARAGVSASTVDLPFLSPSGMPTAWRVTLSGDMASAPCTCGERIVVSHWDRSRSALSLVGLDRSSGRWLWQTELARAAVPAASSADTPTLPVPVCDGERVYLPAAVSGQLVLHAVQLDGRLLWQREIGPLRSPQAYRSSPVLAGSLVIVTADQQGSRWDRWREPSYIAGIHRLTGDVVWLTRRSRSLPSETPLCVRTSGRWQVIVASLDGIDAYDPATGASAWTVRWPRQRTIPALAADDGHVYVCPTDDGQPLLAIRTDGAGDVSTTHILWQSRRVAGRSASITAHAGRLLLWSQDGQVSGLDATSGDVLWTQRLTGRYPAPPVIVGRAAVGISQDGLLTALDWNQQGQVLAQSPVGAAVESSPVPLPEGWLIRTRDELIRLQRPSPAALVQEPDEAAKRPL